MRQILIAPALAAAALLSACATSVYESGVVDVGDGVMMLSRQDYGFNWSGGKIKAELIQQAGEHCKRQGKQLSLVSDQANDAEMTKYASAEIKFRCR